MKRIKSVIFIIIGVWIVGLIIYLLNPTPKVGDEIRPLSKRFLNYLVEKKIDPMYKEFFKDTTLSLDDVKNKVHRFYEKFGNLKSFKLSRSNFGGNGYFIQFTLTNENKIIYQGRFDFIFDDKTDVLSHKDLDMFEVKDNSTRGDPKLFIINFKSGKMFMGKPGHRNEL